MGKLLLSKLTHIFGELLTNSSELNKNVGCTQARAFRIFLQDSVGHPKHEIVNKMKAVRVRMPWRTTDNVTDCRILCIRHMGSYFDQKDKSDCGFKNNKGSQYLELNITPINRRTTNGLFPYFFCLHDKKLFDVMRARYCYEIINNEENIYRNRVKRLIREFHNKQQAELNAKFGQPQVPTT